MLKILRKSHSYGVAAVGEVALNVSWGLVVGARGRRCGRSVGFVVRSLA